MDTQNWYEAEDDETMARELWSVSEKLDRDQETRRTRLKALVDLYESRDPLEIGHDPEDSSEGLTYNLINSACDTVHAEIAGRQKPVPKFQTSGATWDIKRKAKRLERFCCDVIASPHGQYLTGWELMEDVFLDSPIQGVGAAKVTSCIYDGVGDIKLERVDPGSLLVDPVEAQDGRPWCMYQRHVMDRNAAIWEFADDPELELSNEERARIRAVLLRAGADRFVDDVQVSGTNAKTNRIKIYEGWSLARSEDYPGVHAFVCDGELLFSEEWRRKSFPFAVIRWTRERRGFWGIGLADIGMSIHHEVNFNARKLQDRFRICGAKRVWIPRSAGIKIEELQSNEAESFIEYDGQTPPTESAPKVVADAEVAWVDANISRFFEVTGVSQMRATARKEPGVTAGVAIRTMNDMQTARFSLRAKAYENSYVALSYLIIQEARELDAAGVKVRQRKGEEIKWKDVEVPDSLFEIGVAPASSLPNDPGGRMQITNELLSAGVITPETYKQLLGWPDLEKEMNHQTSQTRWLEKRIDKMLDGEEYEPPDEFIIDKPRALLQVAQAYFEALYDDAPEGALASLRIYMQELNIMVEDVQRKVAMAAMQLQQTIMAQQDQLGQPTQPGANPANVG